jgi:hypothetical protein
MSPIFDQEPLVGLGAIYLGAMRAGGEAALHTDKTINDLKRPNLQSLFRHAEAYGLDDIRDLNRDLIESAGVEWYPL